jgi:hypothetical protein
MQVKKLTFPLPPQRSVRESKRQERERERETDRCTAGEMLERYSGAWESIQL